ncbi:ABC transporter permease [Pseudonocardia kujensis]|uniref:ABC transporter permease n=1 Tax=Pseudonocardia kujensis TaxID=1128675 RepID=UPI001E398FD5|nr:ABC transporter permease [Pseudonocardia kujensis]MCE0765791.1 ABC transporter permease [Pseudonocardia kujensis]
MTQSVQTRPGIRAPEPRPARRLTGGSLGSWFLPVVAAVIMFVVIFAVAPAASSYLGLSLLLSSLLPLVLACLAQMFVIAAGDVDLGIGSFVGLVNVTVATILPTHTLTGILLLVGLVVAYALMGMLIAVRRLPSIIVTLGMSFVWLGLAILILPTPGGTVPEGIVSFVDWSPPLVPGTIVAIVVVTVVVALFLNRTRYGAVLRGSGSNPEGIRRAGWSVVRTKMALYGIAGLLGVLSGIVLSGQAASGDPNIATSYVLLSIAGVIVGGGSFRGGDVSPVGTVAGALVIGLIATLLQFLDVPSSYQVGTQGLVLVLILVLRAGVTWWRRRIETGGLA